MIGNGIQLYGKINVFYMATIRHLNLNRSKIQNTVYSCQNQLIGNTLSFTGRRGDHPNKHIFFFDFFFEFIHMTDDDSIWKTLTDLLRIHIECSRKNIAVLSKIPVPQKGGPQIAHSNHCKIPWPVETEDFFNLIDKITDSIAYASDPEFTEISQIFSDLSRIDTTLFGQALRRYDFHIFLSKLL